MSRKYKIGYTQGVFDMFHIGHLNLLNHAKEMCDYLIVGVNSDRLVEEYKHKSTVIKENDRLAIVSNIKAVDQCFLTDTLDKLAILQQIRYDVIFIGDDWKGNERWEKTERDLQKEGIDLIYLPHTAGVSSTSLREIKGL
ncbi:MAG: adenylyltransferase/cytidyltransferase family protein [Clostridia bacterium]|nr:adenylyltransferase/cytidyltransferase family protein [Clostridia bacterium]